MDSSLSLTEMSQSQYGTSMPIGEEESIPLFLAVNLGVRYRENRSLKFID